MVIKGLKELTLANRISVDLKTLLKQAVRNFDWNLPSPKGNVKVLYGCFSAGIKAKMLLGEKYMKIQGNLNIELIQLKVKNK